MRRLVVAFTAMTVVLVGLTTPTVAGVSDVSGDQRIAWHDCHTSETPERLQCATVTVPLDWSDPDGPTIDLAVNRLPATDTANRIGALLVNPGGPGGSGTQAVYWGGVGLSTAEFRPLLQHFDIIGFDPRGVGASTAVTCPNPLRDPSVTTLPETQEDYLILTAANRDAGGACLEQSGALMYHVDTRSAARDIEAIRIALGEETISWLGLSYGTELGAIYAQMFPHRVRSVVLDGAIDHSRSTRQAAVEEPAAIEDAFLRFAAWCQSDETCALYGRDVSTLFTALTVLADDGRIRERSGKIVTAAQLTEGVYAHLQLRESWPTLAGALSEAFGAQPDVSTLVAATIHDSSYAAYVTIGCHDFPGEVRGFADLSDRIAQTRQAAAHMWRYSELWLWTTSCVGWPIPAGNPPRAEQIRGASPIVVVGTTHDPATPYAWAQSLAADIENSRLLTYDGDGHTATYNSSCARSTSAVYLISGVLPDLGEICRF